VSAVNDRNGQKREAMSSSQTTEVPNDVSDRVISRAIGEELRRAREAGGWSRAQFVKLLPSGIGDRTLLSYELAPRGALFYPPRSGEGLEDLSLGLMAYLDPKW
jgi:hypothetical protein